MNDITGANHAENPKGTREFAAALLDITSNMAVLAVVTLLEIAG